ncbi:dihydroneopterin aldolase [Pedobacter sp. UYEF25]
MNHKLMRDCMQTVALKDVKVFAFHGFYPEEQILGSHFIVDLEVNFIPLAFEDELSTTVNYEELNDIILLEMEQTKKLLETVLKCIMARIVAKYAFINAASVSIKKLNPLMRGQVGCSFVRLNYSAKSQL